MSVHRVISLVREVPDLASACAYYVEFGLQETKLAWFLGKSQM